MCRHKGHLALSQDSEHTWSAATDLTNRTHAMLTTVALCPHLSHFLSDLLLVTVAFVLS